MVRLGEVSPVVWDDVVEKLQKDGSQVNFDDIVADWRRSANLNKFDRELFEKYGYFKDIILHPWFQRAKLYLMEEAAFEFSFIVGDPIIPTATTVIVLFMLNKRVRYPVLMLIAAFAFNINPLYVVVISVLYWMLSARHVVPRGYRRHNAQREPDDWRTYVPSPVSVHWELSSAESRRFDHVLVGSDIATLYTAALLARNGHRCCVLQPSDGPVQQVFPAGSPCSAPLVDLSIGKVERYQILLDAAAASSEQQSPQPRVVFHSLDTATNGFVSAVIESHCTAQASTERPLRAPKALTLTLRAGQTSFVSDVCGLLHADRAAVLGLVHSLGVALQFLATHLVSRSVSPASWLQSGLANADGQKVFTHLATSSVEQIAPKYEEDEQQTADMLRCLMGAATAGAQEALPATQMSAYCLAHTLAAAANGTFYPAGGHDAIEQALSRTIRRSGGAVLRGVEVSDVVLEEVGSNGVVKATGVRVMVLSTGIHRNVHAKTGTGKPEEEEGEEEEIQLQASLSVVSGLGALCTYTKLVPIEALSQETQRMLCTLQEARPLLRVVYWLAGSSEQLGLEGAAVDNVEVGALGAMPQATNYVRVWSPSAKDPNWSEKSLAHSTLHVLVVEMSAGDDLVRPEEFLLKYSGSSSTEEAHAGGHSVCARGPTLYRSTHSSDDCTSPQHRDYTDHLGYSVTMDAAALERVRSTADAKLRRLYPRASGEAVVFVHVEVPRLGGHAVANTPAKFACGLSAVTDVQNLFLTGSDVATMGLTGQLQSGWAAANAALGYTVQELTCPDSKRNVVADLDRQRQVEKR